ncbi:hypothetical protein [Pseudoduganella lutea]|uniref:Uncharacterized protein n=1 Tax=Pseudoduganella lutea TaxID=321985 RepID=A0A4P6KWK3_9BURK|nr:hypothetical protein [Pseudoduganella lutea]QBE62578.1 hypothetical protein EWM63_05995 [Pseudoduganella lutea]
MQVVENWAWVTCRLEAVHDAGQVTELEVTVESTGPVQGFPDLLARYVGERVRIRLGTRLGTRPHLPPGSRFRIKARVAGPHAIWGSADTVAAAD